MAGAARGGKGRKIGRGQKKKSRIRYKAEGRAAINKEKKRLKQEKIEEKHALKKAAREQERLTYGEVWSNENIEE